MRIAFWRYRQEERDDRGQTAKALDGDDCQHDWLNWTQPEPHAAKVVNGGGFSPVYTEREGLVQTRTCTKCNLFIRRVC